MNNERELNSPAPRDDDNLETPNNTETTPSEPNNNEKKQGFFKGIFDFIEMLAISIIVVLFVFSFCFRLCRVDGNSMNKTLNDQEMLITTNLFYTPQQGDVVVFHLSNDHYSQPLVKRVIAVEGETVKIDFTSGRVYVNNVLLDEKYAFVDGGIYRVKNEFDKQYLSTDINGHTIFEAEVPEGHIFVMGDNRNHSTDSRSTLVGFVNKNCILGKAIIRLSPFTTFN